MNAQIYEEATLWLIEHREKSLSAKQRREFDNWLRQSPHHVRAYLEISAIWEDVPALDANWNPTASQLIDRARNEENVCSLAESARTPVIADSAWRRFSSTKRGGAWREVSMRFVAVSAVFLVAIVGVAIWNVISGSTYSTGIGEQRSIVLADGSIVELNSRSRLRIRYTAAQRDIDLIEGQALFRVAHNAARPFVVHSGAVNVRAVGTEFDVYKKRVGTIVTVVEGKVAVLASALPLRQDFPAPREDRADGHNDSQPERSATGEASGAATAADAIDPPDAARSTRRSVPLAGSNVGGQAILLAAGEQLTVSNAKSATGSAGAGPQRTNVAAATAWTHRSLVFESMPLAEVAEEFNRYNSRQLVIVDPELTHIRISGMFSSEDPALLLKFLKTQPELSINETETEVRISRQ